MKSIRLKVPNGVLFIKDASSREFPVMEDQSGVWASRSMICLMCRHEQEGETHITFGSSDEISRKGQLIVRGTLETPSRKIVIVIVPGEEILTADTRGDRTEVKVWGNAGKHSNKVAIGIE